MVVLVFISQQLWIPSNFLLFNNNKKRPTLNLWFRRYYLVCAFHHIQSSWKNSNPGNIFLSGGPENAGKNSCYDNSLLSIFWAVLGGTLDFGIPSSCQQPPLTSLEGKLAGITRTSLSCCLGQFHYKNFGQRWDKVGHAFISQAVFYT